MEKHVSRRNFIKKTAAVAAALVFTSSAQIVLNAGEAFAKPKVNKKNKIAPIIKTGIKSLGGKDVVWLSETSAEYRKLMLPKIHLPLIAQNGGLVPLTIDSKHPMAKSNYIKAFHIFDLNNPVSKIAIFNLTPENGKAYIATRLKIQQDSYVQVVTEFSDGKMYGSKKYLKVTVGGC